MSTSEPTATWNIPLSDGNHVVEFEHGTASGRRVVRVDGKTLVHKDWMFYLVGEEIVMFRDTKLVIRVDPIPGFKYCYTLWVNNKSYKNFIQAQSKVLQSWLAKVSENQYRIVLDKNTQNVWVNGELVDVENEFVDDGAEMLFSLKSVPAVIRSYSSGHRKMGMNYTLFIDGAEVTEQEILSPQIKE